MGSLSSFPGIIDKSLDPDSDTSIKKINTEASAAQAVHM